MIGEPLSGRRSKLTKWRSYLLPWYNLETFSIVSLESRPVEETSHWKFPNSPFFLFPRRIKKYQYSTKCKALSEVVILRSIKYPMKDKSLGVLCDDVSRKGFWNWNWKSQLFLNKRKHLALFCETQYFVHRCVLLPVIKLLFKTFTANQSFCSPWSHCPSLPFSPSYVCFNFRKTAIA